MLRASWRASAAAWHMAQNLAHECPKLPARSETKLPSELLGLLFIVRLRRGGVRGPGHGGAVARVGGVAPGGVAAAAGEEELGLPLPPARGVSITAPPYCCDHYDRLRVALYTWQLGKAPSAWRSASVIASRLCGVRSYC